MLWQAGKAWGGQEAHPTHISRPLPGGIVADEDRWIKLEQVVEKVVRRVLQEHGFKPKTKVSFRNGFFTGLGEIEMAALEAAYPAVDVKAQIKEAAAWIVMHPNDAPRSNYGAFLNSWLKKHQNQHALRSIAAPKPQQIQRQTCAYCQKTATSSTNGIWSCDDHSHDAMDGVRPMGAVKRA